MCIRDRIGTTPWDDGYFLAAFSKLASDPVQSLVSCKLTRDYVDEGMKEFYRFRNKLYNNGLVHPEYYALPTDDYISYICLLYTSPMYTMTTSLIPLRRPTGTPALNMR